MGTCVACVGAALNSIGEPCMHPGWPACYGACSSARCFCSPLWPRWQPCLHATAGAALPHGRASSKSRIAVCCYAPDSGGGSSMAAGLCCRQVLEHRMNHTSQALARTCSGVAAMLRNSHVRGRRCWHQPAGGSSGGSRLVGCACSPAAPRGVVRVFTAGGGRLVHAIACAPATALQGLRLPSKAGAGRCCALAAHGQPGPRRVC